MTDKEVLQCEHCNSTNMHDHGFDQLVFDSSIDEHTLDIATTVLCYDCGTVYPNEKTLEIVVTALKTLPEYESCDEKYLIATAKIMLSVRLQEE